MSSARTIAKNTTVLFIATLVSYILALFTTSYSGKYLGPEGFGIISLALALTGIFSVFTDLGLNTLMVREIARDKLSTNKYITTTALMKIFTSILTFLLMALTVYLLKYPPLVANVIYLITFSIILAAFYGSLNSVFQAYEKMEYISIGNALNAVFVLAGILITMYFNLGILALASVYIIAGLIVLIYTIIVYLLKFPAIKLDIDLKFGKSLFKEAIPFGITNIFSIIYYSIGTIMLSKMVNIEVVGWYSAAYRLMQVFLSFYTVYLSAVFPVMSKFHETAEDSLKFTFERSYKYLLIISIPIAVGTTLLADKIILLFFGKGFDPAVLCLQILIWTIPIIFINGLSGYFLGAVNRQIVTSKLTFIGVIINVALNLVLIPTFSLIGTSAAILITEFVLTLIIVYLIFKTGYTDKSLFNKFPHIIISNVVMAVLVIFLINMNLFLIIILASITYFVAIYVFRALDELDMAIVKSIIKR